MTALLVLLVLLVVEDLVTRLRHLGKGRTCVCVGGCGFVGVGSCKQRNAAPPGLAALLHMACRVNAGLAWCLLHQPRVCR